MKRKIQHDAINNQEDEDSSAYPIYLLNDESFPKKKKGLVKSNIDFFSNKEFKNKVNSEFKRKIQ